MTDHDFFARTEDKLLAGMRRGAHMPWPARARRRVRSLNRRSQALGIVIIALVVAAPAVAAVSGWFAVGEPLSAGRPTPNASSGSVTPQGAHMFALRFDDPAGGPKWGLRQVLTTRGDVCLQVGRVERDQIGSIGINGLWHDDHEFHETPPGALYGDDVTCEPPLKGRYAYFEAYDLGDNASAMAGWTNGCRVSANNGSALKPVCPAGTNRMVYYDPTPRPSHTRPRMGAPPQSTPTVAKARISLCSAEPRQTACGTSAKTAVSRENATATAARLFSVG
jgi:hypothetical protein